MSSGIGIEEVVRMGSAVAGGGLVRDGGVSDDERVGEKAEG